MRRVRRDADVADRECARGDLTLTVASTASLAAGQYLKVYTSGVISFTGMMQGEFVRIERVDSGTQVTLADPLLDTYNMTDTARLSVWTFNTCEWDGGLFVGPSDPTVLISGLSLSKLICAPPGWQSKPASTVSDATQFDTAIRREKPE